jgi:hypothetical protein
MPGPFRYATPETENLFESLAHSADVEIDGLQGSPTIREKAMALLSRRALTSGILGLTILVGSAADLRAQTSALRGPAVVELFTSQGCSSCPPADRVLGELSTMPNVIALAFHVDYWDNIGWRDPFSISNAVERQHRYVQALNLSSAFTPQAVIDGHSSFVGSDKGRILNALADATGDTVPVSLEVSDGVLTVTLPERQDRTVYSVFVAAYLPQASTPVGRGENSGKTLQEFNIVRQFRSIGTWSGHAAMFRSSVSSFPADASRVAVLVQREGQGPIAGSAAIALR